MEYEVPALALDYKQLDGHEVMAIIAPESSPTVIVKGVLTHMPVSCVESQYDQIEGHIHVGDECFVDAYTVWGMICTGDVFNTFMAPDSNDTTESVKITLEINYQGSLGGYDEAVRITVEEALKFW